MATIPERQGRFKNKLVIVVDLENRTAKVLGAPQKRGATIKPEKETEEEWLAKQTPEVRALNEAFNQKPGK